MGFLLYKPHEFVTLAGVNSDYMLLVPGDIHTLAKALRCFQVKTFQWGYDRPYLSVLSAWCLSNCLSEFKGSFLMITGD